MKRTNVCFYCHTAHSSDKKARQCESEHDVVMVPFLRSDLNRLVNFVATGERNLLTESLSKTLFKYFRSGS